MHTDTDPATGARALNVLALLTAVAALLMGGVAVWAVVDYATYDGDDPLIALDLLLAFAAGAPAALAAALALAGWLLRHRRPGLAQGLVVCGATVVAFPVVVAAWLLLSPAV